MVPVGATETELWSNSGYQTRQLLGWQGVSRSVMVLMAYLMKRHQWSVQEALDFVKTKRDGARPNPAFRELLNQWEAELKLGDGDKKSG